MLAFRIQMVNGTELRPVNRSITQGRFSLGFALFRNRVPVIADADAEYQSYSSHNSGNLLHLGVGILIDKEHIDQERDESKAADNDTHIVPEPELYFILFGYRIHMVGLLPELSTDNNKDEINYEESDQLSHLGNELEVNFSDKHENSKYFTGNGKHPENYSQNTLCFCTALVSSSDRGGSFCGSFGGRLFSRSSSLCGIYFGNGFFDCLFGSGFIFSHFFLSHSEPPISSLMLLYSFFIRFQHFQLLSVNLFLTGEEKKCIMGPT